MTALATLSSTQPYVEKSSLKNNSANPPVDIIRAVAYKLGIDVEALSGDWVLALTRKEKRQIVYGYQFPLNDASSAFSCCDKAAASALLKVARIPHIRTRIFSSMSEIETYAQKHQNNLVCKPKNGSGGSDISHIRNPNELVEAVNSFRSERDLVLCAFKKIKHEFRVIMLENKAQVIFEKIPLSVKGDGEKTLSRLVSERLEKMVPFQAQIAATKLDPSLFSSEEIPKLGDTVLLQWKHNLGQGAQCHLLGGEAVLEANPKMENDPVCSRLIELAQKTVDVLKVCFVSVDIVVLEDEPNPQKVFRVMEINSGIMMNSLIKQHKNFGQRIAEIVYGKALKLMFPTDK